MFLEVPIRKGPIIPNKYVKIQKRAQEKPTIGVDFALKVINWDSETIIRLQLWDIAGQERFGTMTRVYYRDAVAAFIVFDFGAQHF